jgi:hypothetical protein
MKGSGKKQIHKDFECEGTNMTVLRKANFWRAHRTPKPKDKPRSEEVRMHETMNHAVIEKYRRRITLAPLTIMRDKPFSEETGT